MLTLAIETSGLVGSLALLDDAVCLEERTLELGKQHGQTLVPEIRRLLKDLGRTPRDCGLLAVSVGPGSFTGLRVGIVCAKTWAYATGCRVVAVDTHQAIAGNTPGEIPQVEVVSDAQRGDVFVSRFVQGGDSRWRESVALGYLPTEEWMARLGTTDVVSGPGLEKRAGQLAGRCRLLEPTAWRPRAAEIGRLGALNAAAGEFADLWSLEPLYLRSSSAEEKWDLRKRQ